MCESSNDTSWKLAIELVEKLIIIYKDKVIETFYPVIEERIEDVNSNVSKAAV